MERCLGIVGHQGMTKSAVQRQASPRAAESDAATRSPAVTRRRMQHESGTLFIRSADTGEDWTWCYVHEVTFDTPTDDASRAF